MYYYFRPVRNYCKSCKYTWYPRGHYLSSYCPSCGGPDVWIDNRGLWIVAVATFAACSVGVYDSFRQAEDAQRPVPAESTEERVADLPIPVPPAPVIAPPPRPAIPRQPLAVTLVAPVQFPVTIGGKPSGSVNLPPGTRLELISVNGDKLIVKYLNSTARLPQSFTDFQVARP